MLAAVLPLAVMALATGDRPPAVRRDPMVDVEPELPVARPVAAAPARPETCPGFVRDLLKLDASATVSCAPGRFPDDGYFVRGFYRTSELWERVAVVAADGSRFVVPPEDQPSRLQRDGDSACVVAIDLDGDGVDEVLTTYRVDLADRTAIGVEARRPGVAIEYLANRQLLSENLCAPCQNLEILRASGEPVRYPRCSDRKVDDLVSVTGDTPTRR